MFLAYYQSVDLFLFCPFIPLVLAGLNRKENICFLCELPPGRRPHGPEAASRAKPRIGGISALLQRAVMPYSRTSPHSKAGAISVAEGAKSGTIRHLFCKPEMKIQEGLYPFKRSPGLSFQGFQPGKIRFE